MALIEQMKIIIKEYEKQIPLLKHNAEMIDIYEGNLLPYIKRELQASLSPDSYKDIVDRIVPINLLRRMVDKQSKIYQKGVVRRVEDGSEADKEFVADYEETMRFDDRMNRVNEYFNMFKYAFAQPVAYNKRRILKPVANDRFFVMSTDPIDELHPTHVIFVDRAEKTAAGEEVVVFHAYTDTEFLIFDSKEQVRTEEMAAFQNAEGVNPYGVLPGQYFNRSTNYLMPKPDLDLYKMVILVPVLLSDLAFAIKYQAFAILYGIDVDFENLKRSPNVFWALKSDKGGIGADGKKPEIGTIKPEVDIDQVLRFTQACVAMFLQTRGIRPGSVGQLTVENFSSGISKMIEEMDTFEDRNAQIEVFQPGEVELWEKITKNYHPIWVSLGHVEGKHQFSPNAYVTIDFPEQIPMQERGTLVKDLQTEVDAGFTTRKRAIKRLNPGMSDKEIDELLAEIEAEKQANMKRMADQMGEGNDEEETEEDESDGLAEGQDSDTAGV